MWEDMSVCTAHGDVFGHVDDYVQEQTCVLRESGDLERQV